MCKTLTPELFAKLKNVKSSKGYSLSNVIQAGVLLPDLDIGCTMGDEECFELFKDLIDPIVKDWHQFDPATQTHKSDLNYDRLVFTAEDRALFAKYVKSTRIRAARNISGFSLPAGSSMEDRLAVEEVLKTAFSNLPNNLKGTYFPLGGLGDQEDELRVRLSLSLSLSLSLMCVCVCTPIFIHTLSHPHTHTHTHTHIDTHTCACFHLPGVAIHMC
jgi:creatine kinase